MSNMWRYQIRSEGCTTYVNDQTTARRIARSWSTLGPVEVESFDGRDDWTIG